MSSKVHWAEPSFFFWDLSLSPFLADDFVFPNLVDNDYDDFVPARACRIISLCIDDVSNASMFASLDFGTKSGKWEKNGMNPFVLAPLVFCFFLFYPYFWCFFLYSLRILIILDSSFLFFLKNFILKFVSSRMNSYYSWSFRINSRV